MSRARRPGRSRRRASGKASRSIQGSVTVARVVVVGILSLVVAAGCGGSSHSKGFLDHTQLEARISEQANAAIRNHSGEAKANGIPAGTTVTDVFCIKSTDSDRKFDCKVNLSNGDGFTTKILVSEDGQTFVPVDN
jgi:hypothetical protein